MVYYSLFEERQLQGPTSAAGWAHSLGVLGTATAPLNTDGIVFHYAVVRVPDIGNWVGGGASIQGAFVF